MFRRVDRPDGTRAPVASRPRVEGLERRDLLTILPFMLDAAAEQTSANALISGFPAAEAAGTSTTPNSSQGTVTTPGSPYLNAVLPYQGDTPTALEQANEKYTAVFTGFYKTTVPRFTDQASQTYVQAVGSTTDELHGDVQLSIVVPNGPTSTNPLGDVQGVGINLDKNNADGSVLAFDIYGDPTSSLNSAGRPTNLQWSESPFTGSGSFTGGLYNLAEGAGTLSIYYKPSKGKHPAGVFSQGTVTVVMQGLIFKPGTTSSFATANLEVTHSVPKAVGPKAPKVVHSSSSTALIPPLTKPNTNGQLR